MPLEFSPSFQRAFDAMEKTQANVFITGKAGTGKSTLLRYFRDTTKKNTIVVAPTGVAALNIEGETIHSFFHFKPGVTIAQAKKIAVRADRNLYKQLATVVIDEISMVRADLLDCVDVFLKTIRKSQSPFGGIQIICIGDLYQLPPVVKNDEQSAVRQRYETPYFFSADVMCELLASHALTFIELDKIYRQSDPLFIGLLNAVRNRSATVEHLERLNQRCCVGEASARMTRAYDAFSIHLTSINAQADAINQKKLGEIRGHAQIYTGTVRGDFLHKDLPTEMRLALKCGARVMLVHNDSAGRWINGTLGTVKNLSRENVTVKLDDGHTVSIEPWTWTLYRSVYDLKTRNLGQERIGSFTQLPLRLAWATTIHKSQGKTFDRVTIDMSRGMFAPGQLYVALSRCRAFDGITLTHPLKLSHLLLDYRVVKFLTAFQYSQAERSLSLQQKEDMLRNAIKHKQKIRITYLKAKDEKSCRVILPKRLANMEYAGHQFLGVDAYCCTRQDDRVFNVARILEMCEEK